MVDLALNFNVTSTRTIKLDTIPPEVNITFPEDITYKDNDIDVEVVINEFGYCNYSYDGGVTNETLDTLDNLTFTGIILNIPVGDYTLEAYCTDLVGNANNTINVSFNYEPSSGGSGGGGGSAAHIYTEKESKEGIVQRLNVFDRIRIVDLAGEHHNIILKGISGNSIVIEVASVPQQITLEVGDEKMLEINGDNYYDILIDRKSTRLNSSHIPLSRMPSSA